MNTLVNIIKIEQNYSQPVIIANMTKIILVLTLLLSFNVKADCYKLLFEILDKTQKHEVSLYDSPGIQTAKYNDFVKNALERKLRPNTILNFSDGESFQILKVLGAGGTTLIMRAKNTRTGQVSALRVPRENGSFFGFFPFTHFNKSSVEALDDLRRLNATIPKVYSYDKTGSGEYMSVEIIDIDFDGFEFVANPKGLGLSDKQFQEAKDELINFARTHAHIAHIGDFKADQIVYSVKDKKWTILDWNNSEGGAYEAKSIRSDQLFNDYFFYNLRAERFDDGRIDFDEDTFEPVISRENTEFELHLKEVLQEATFQQRNIQGLPKQ